MFIIVSGPAGVGKNTVITNLLNRYSNLKLMKTCTTRAPRATDTEMQSPYIYLSRQEFEKKIINGELFEHEEIHQNYYGTLNKSLEEIIKNENDFIKDLGVLGHKNMKRALRGKAKVLSIFLTAPKSELVKRLKNRGDKDIELRMSRMEFELSFKNNYDLVIDNNDLNKTLEIIEQAIKKAKAYEKRMQKKEK